MGDIAEYFVHHDVRNFYSVSISGYHIAEARRDPISQLAFTLRTLHVVEAYLARGINRRLRANLSFFFSNGMDPSTPCSPRRAPHLGGGDERALRANNAARSSVPRPAQWAAACTRRRSRSTTSAPHCRR